MSKLSEEEIIKECEDLANNEYHELGDCWDEEYSKEAICGLLDLYKKEKEKNQGLQIFVDDIKEGVYIDTPEFEENYISKDKIREKLKIRKEEKAECTDSIEAKYLLREIYILEELLGE